MKITINDVRKAIYDNYVIFDQVKFVSPNELEIKAKAFYEEFQRMDVETFMACFKRAQAKSSKPVMIVQVTEEKKASELYDFDPPSQSAQLQIQDAQNPDDKPASKEWVDAHLAKYRAEQAAKREAAGEKLSRKDLMIAARKESIRRQEEAEAKLFRGEELNESDKMLVERLKASRELSTLRQSLEDGCVHKDDPTRLSFDLEALPF